MDSRSSNPCVQGPTVFLKITYFQISNLDGTGTTTYEKKKEMLRKLAIRADYVINSMNLKV